MTENRDRGQSQPIQDEVADDQIIGVAFKRSVMVFACVAVVAAIVTVIMLWPTSAPPPGENPDVDVLPLQDTPSPPPDVTFTDITVEAGIDFVHESGATGEKLLPETMGGGSAFLDYDNDGDQDIVLVSGAAWAHTGGDSPASSVALYENDGWGLFTNVSESAGFGDSFYGMGAGVGDIDNDGDSDLFVSAVGGNRLYRNDGGQFVDITGQAGVAGDDDAWSTSVGFFDADNDGDLDLFVCNYVRWSREIDFEVGYTLTGVGRAYGPPTNFEGTFPYFYLNNGDGTFVEVAEDAGMHIANDATGAAVCKALGVLFYDFDDDGLQDIVVANDTTRNLLFHNLGDAKFEEIGSRAGVAYDSMGSSTGAMGIDSARHRAGSLAIAIGNFANEMTSFYVAEENVWQFIDSAIGEGIGAPSRLALSFGLFFFDYDLDGRLDLFQTNGHLEEEINTVQPSQHYRQPSQLFWNAGEESRLAFVQADPDSLGDLSTPVVGRGASYADIDADGDLDILVTQIADRPLLLRNDQDLDHNWVRVIARGVSSNRDAIGARIIVRSGEVEFERVVQPTRSYLSQVELPVTIGLGEIDAIDEIVVRWPAGGESRVTDARPGTTVTIEENVASP